MEKRIRHLFLLLIGLTFYYVEAGSGISQFFDNSALQSRLFNDANSADLSISFLRVLFGSVSTLGGTNSITGEIFRMFNMGVLIVVSVTIGYTVITSVLGSAQDGTGAFSTRVSPWTLFRVVTGVSVMVPMGQGYSVLQTIVMRIVLLGIAMANTAWVGTITFLENNNGRLQGSPTLSTPATTALKNNTETATNYLTEIYEQLWEKMYHPSTGLCTGRPSCSVDLRVVPMASTKNIKYIIRRASDRQEECFELPALIPTELHNTTELRTDADVTLAMTLSASLLTSPTKQLLGKVIFNHTNPLFSTTMPPAAPLPGQSVTAPTDWEASHNAWHSRFAGTDLLVSTNVTRISGLWRDARLRMNGLSNNIAGYAYSYAMSMQASYPAILAVGRGSSPSSNWYTVAKNKGWLASGMYYSKLMVDPQSTGSSSTTMTLGYGTLSGPLNPSVIKAPPITVGISPAVASQMNGGTYDSNVQALAREKVVGILPTTSPIGSTGSPHTSTTTSLSGFSTSFSTILNGKMPRSSKHKGMTLAQAIQLELNAFDDFLPKSSGKGSDAAYNLIPHLSGYMGGSYWMYGTDVAKPISTLAVMMREILVHLIGIDQSQSGCSINRKAFPLFTVYESTATPKKESCLYQGSMLHTMFYPDVPVNAIAMVQSLGSKMVSESIRYYRDTVEGLYDEVKHLADSHFGVTTAISVAAAAAEAGTYGTVAAMAGVAASVAAEIANTGFKMAYNGIKVALDIYVPLGTSVAAMMFTLGIILGVYIPMMPFLLFLFGMVAWLMSVIEAMVAAPLVALGVTHPEGHDILGKAEQAMMLLLGVFVRPITMLFGMIMAVIVSQLLLKLFHIGFMQILVTFLTASGSPSMEKMAIVLLGVLMIYIYVLINVVEQSFSLVYVIPERILRWVGGPQDQTGVGQLAEQTKGEVQQAAGQAAQGASQSTAAPSLQAPTINMQTPGGGGDVQEEDGGKEDSGADASAGGIGDNPEGNDPSSAGGGNGSTNEKSSVGGGNNSTKGSVGGGDAPTDNKSSVGGGDSNADQSLVGGGGESSNNEASSNNEQQGSESSGSNGNEDK